MERLRQEKLLLGFEVPAPALHASKVSKLLSPCISAASSSQLSPELASSCVDKNMQLNCATSVGAVEALCLH